MNIVIVALCSSCDFEKAQVFLTRRANRCLSMLLNASTCDVLPCFRLDAV